MRKLLLIPILMLGLIFPFILPANAAPRPLALGFYAGPHNGTISPSDYSAFGRKPNAVIYYSWNPTQAPVQPFIGEAKAQGIEPFIEVQTGSQPLNDLAAWQSGYITQAKAIKANGVHVMMTFDHEFNGDWHPWNGSPVQWISAWNYVTRIFNEYAPGMITWVWAPNVDGGAQPAKAWWRNGSQFVLRVNEIGLDGYLCITETTGSCSQSFQSVFQTSLRQIRQYTQLPVIVSETGIGPPDNRAAEIQAMVSQARSEGFNGVYWFNQGQFTLTPAEMGTLATALS